MNKPFVLSILACCSLVSPAFCQSLGSAGTIDGAVVDPSGAVVPNATVQILNPISRHTQSVKSDPSGQFRFSNIPPNPYHLTVVAPGFAGLEQDVEVRSTVPIHLRLQLRLGTAETSVNVESNGADLIENVPYAHTDADQGLISQLPTPTPGSGLSDAVTYSVAGVAADANGFFHPLGDHAQVSFVIDGQPISDQQSKVFSTQLPLNAVQSMEMITGTPNAEFGDKTSLVVNTVTQSGLGKGRVFGSLIGENGSFGTWGEEGTIGFGNSRFGNFLVANGLRSGRILDTPEFLPLHAIGNNETIFDRLDFQPTAQDALHLNLFFGRNWFQVPNTYDQLTQDQKQRALTYNIAPGYQHTFNANALLTVNPYLRLDEVHYYGSRDPFDDVGATLGQSRRLLNYGVKADLSVLKGKNNFKFGTQLTQTRLQENFSLGITDPGFNAVCVDDAGSPLGLPNVTNPDDCSGLGYTANPDVQVGLIPYDLTRGGSLFQFNDRGHVNQYAFYGQDTITLGNLTVNAGLRFDQYNGPSSGNLVQPRAGISYLVKRTNTVLRFGYARTFETPFNENLLLSSVTGAGGLGNNAFGNLGATPLEPGKRNLFNTGSEQAIGRYLRIDGDYFWKYTDNAYDFGVVFNTPITFPISWKKSKIDGVSARISTVNIKGFQAYATIGHTRSRYFAPENGGLIFDSPLNTSVFRIDHDQALQSNVNLRYQFRNEGSWPWVSFTWRYDSGLVAGAVGSVGDALALTAAQQAAIGFYCGGVQATRLSPITADQCDPDNPPTPHGATRLSIPAEGTEDDDHNPPRIAPRHIFDLGVGTDNLFHTDHNHVLLHFSIYNLTNEAALYNFLSTFSGTHFVPLRSYRLQVGYVF